MEKTDASKALDISNELSVRDVRDALRIKHNQTFVLMDEAGEISREKRGYGVYFRDTCYLDTWELRIHGDALIPLAATQLHGSESRMELTNPPLQINGGSVPQGQISIQRRQVVGDALVDELALHNLSPRALDFDLTITMASQFVDLFAIRGARQDRAGRVRPPSYESGQLVLSARGADGHQRRTIIHFDAEPECVEGGTARYHVQIGSREHWRLRTSIKLEDRAPSGDGAARTAGSESAKEQHQRFGQIGRASCRERV